MGGSEVDEELEAAMRDLDDEPEVPPSEETEVSEDDRPEALGETPGEVPVDLYTEDLEDEVDEEEADDADDADDGIQDVCPRCGELAWDEDTGDCLSCISDEVMTFAVNEAKGAHKEGADISSLTPDLKAAKQARQDKDYDEVISVSERIVVELESIVGRDLQGELAERKAGKRKKKKKKKKRA
jgi:hypothetical protein